VSSINSLKIQFLLIFSLQHIIELTGGFQTFQHGDIVYFVI
jgi:hypothetical protein